MERLTLEDAVERLAHLFRAELRRMAGEHGLNLVQLEALHYLAAANRYSDTPAATAEFLGLTKGTVSQTLAALQGKGFVEKTGDPIDRRVTHVALTPAGARVASATRPSPLADEIEAELGAAGTGEANEVLRAVLRAGQRARRRRAFGVCHTCVHFRQEGSGRFRCGLTGEVLRKAETSRICREHAATLA